MITMYANFDVGTYRSFCMPLFDIPRNFIRNNSPYYRIDFVGTTGQIYTEEFSDITSYYNRYSQFIYNGYTGDSIKNAISGYGFGIANIYEWDNEEVFQFVTSSKFQIIDATQPVLVQKYNDYNGTFKAYNDYNI